MKSLLITMLLKNLISKIPKAKRNIKIKGLADSARPFLFPVEALRKQSTEQNELTCHINTPSLPCPPFKRENPIVKHLLNNNAFFQRSESILLIGAMGLTLLANQHSDLLPDMSRHMRQ